MNPVNSMADNGQRVGVSPSNPINDPSFSSRQGSNTFDLSFQNLLTCRYGEITPFFYMSGLGRDRLELRSSHELRTYTLGAPLMSGLRMRKSTFSVSKKAMMPNSFNYLFVNPVKGHDVPNDAYCFLDMVTLIKKIASVAYESYMAYVAGLGSSSTFASTAYENLVKCYVLLQNIVSSGSVLDNLGISLSALFKRISNFDIDLVADEQLNFMAKKMETKTFQINYSLFDPATGETDDSVYLASGMSKSTIFELFQLVAQHPDCSITAPDYTTNYFEPLASMLEAVYNSNYTEKLEINLFKIVAYQMIASQFYSNDHVDNIYNSDLWLSNMTSLCYSAVTGGVQTFSYNGINVIYDTFSNHYLTLLVNEFDIDNMSDVVGRSAMFFLFNLFTFRRSLRYGDYFLSSRPMPLAVGDVSVPVVGQGVNIIDINKNLHIQRFLNAVNRVGSDIVSYARGIFGYTPQEDDARPRFISSEVVYVGSDEIDNTSENQGLINVNMIAQQSNYMFDVDITDECIILGLLSFECTGSYSHAIERDNFHKTRFDSFIPELQHIGDQSVYRVERTGLPSALPFGYQVRYAEYKFKYNQQHGGFCSDSLKNWAFPVNVESSPILDEDSIRSSPIEFDRYYKSLTYGSLANRFHFQISFANNVRANRAMDYQPNLLG